jgi:hypothetical protein
MLRTSLMWVSCRGGDDGVGGGEFLAAASKGLRAVVDEEGGGKLRSSHGLVDELDSHDSDELGHASFMDAAAEGADSSTLPEFESRTTERSWHDKHVDTAARATGGGGRCGRESRC